MLKVFPKTTKMKHPILLKAVGNKLNKNKGNLLYLHKHPN